MDDKWVFYASRVNDEFASISVNLSAKEHAPDRAMPILCWTWVRFQKPRPDGMSDSSEAPTLFRIEDALNEALGRLLSASFVGRITTAGRREFYYYAPSGDGLEAAVRSAMADFAEYSYWADSKPDEEWVQYLDLLYPAPLQMQSIENRAVIEELEKSGDDLQSPRPIVHYAYFATQTDRDAYAAGAAALGFELIPAGLPDDSIGERPFGAHVQRTEAPVQAAIDETTGTLFTLAEKHNGEYDGWETEVVKQHRPKPSLWQRLAGKVKP